MDDLAVSILPNGKFHAVLASVALDHGANIDDRQFPPYNVSFFTIPKSFVYVDDGPVFCSPGQIFHNIFLNSVYRILRMLYQVNDCFRLNPVCVFLLPLYSFNSSCHSPK